eukprot:TRINITY_DN67017_c9_g2_i1.p1 TRINITY_DN67017_c9_g2~~TRINITY_DN67017_c9_g2_i1.p1  ORF type:complete len:735 (+),score=68.02 TRINITY_DN67017_c9_g2_i1:301-2205(+)
MAEALGAELAPVDWMFHLMRTTDALDNTFDLLSKPVQKMLAGYAAGMNHYAALHPDRALLPDLFPFTSRDIAAGIVFRAPFFTGLDVVIKDLMDKKVPTVIQHETRGSSAFAVGPDKTEDGSTHLLINSHQPWDGPLSWYEAHLMTTDGKLNITGGLLWGCPFVLHGHNKDLGWAITVNMPDLVDVFKLDMVKGSSTKFVVDGERHSLQFREGMIRVNLFGPFRWNSKQSFLWSGVHNCPVIPSPHGYYAIKFVPGDARLGELFYDMGKASTLEEWNSIIKRQHISSMNWIYADKKGNIQYTYNAKMPKRSPKWDYHGVIAGNTSENIWLGWDQFEGSSLVLTNPKSGFVVSANSDPFRATHGTEHNLDNSGYNHFRHISDEFQTGRALRSVQLLHNNGKKLSEADIEAAKNDDEIHPDSDFSRLLNAAINFAEDFPTELKNNTDREILRILKTWDRKMSRDNKLAPLPIMALGPLARIGGLFATGMKKKFDNALEKPDKVLWPALRNIGRTLMKTHGALEVRLSDVLRAINPVTGTNVGLGGGPDVMRCVYFKVNHTTGQGVGHQGDSLYMLVKWDKEGNLVSRATHQYGVSPKRFDNLPDFADLKLRPVHMHEPTISQHASDVYTVPPNQDQ